VVVVLVEHVVVEEDPLHILREEEVVVVVEPLHMLWEVMAVAVAAVVEHLYILRKTVVDPLHILQ
jgi:hypothetical protein